jgi:hypothetical protein
VPEISALLGRNVEGNTIGAVLNLFVALLSFGGISTRAYRLKASNAAPRISTFSWAIPRPLIRRSHNLPLDAPRIHDISAHKHRCFGNHLLGDIHQ